MFAFFCRTNWGNANMCMVVADKKVMTMCWIKMGKQLHWGEQSQRHHLSTSEFVGMSNILRLRALEPEETST